MVGYSHLSNINRGISIRLKRTGRSRELRLTLQDRLGRNRVIGAMNGIIE